MFTKLTSSVIVLWETLISVYIEYGDVEEVPCCIGKMQQEGGSPDTITFAYSLKPYSSQVFIDEMHAEVIKKGFKKYLLVGSTLVDMYDQVGLLEVAHHVFDKLAVKDVILCTSLIKDYAEHDHAKDALNCLWVNAIGQCAV